MRLLKNLFSKKQEEKNDASNSRLMNAAAQSGLDVSFDVPNHVKVSSTIYLQNRLSQLVGNSVRLKIIEIDKAKRPKGWDDIRGDAAVVDSGKNLYGVLFDDKLERSGHKVGDNVDCLITRTTQGHIELWIPITAEKMLQNEREEELRFGVNVMEKMFMLDFEGDELDIGRCTVETMDPPKGSKAKPIIRVKTLEGKSICEITGRSGAYKKLEQYIGKTAKNAKAYRKLSDYNEGEIYYRLWFDFSEEA